MSINSFDHYFLSWIPDPSVLSRPKYLALANQLEKDIRSGRLAPGMQLPPQRELADYLGLNFTTVTRAYDLCKERDLIYGITGKGSFVSSLPGTKTPFIKNNVIELGIVNGFDFIRRPVIEATENVLKKGYIDQLYSYSEPAGHIHQRAAGVRWMAEMDVITDIQHTAVFSGAQNAISASLLSLFLLGDKIATDYFTYSNLIGTAKMMHIPLVPVPGDSHGMLPSELEKICRKEKISGIFLMPNCANPTTITMPDERRDLIAEIIRKYRLILIEDDHDGILQNNRKHSLYSRLRDQTVYICGSTKNLCSGLRVTFAAFPERFRACLMDGLHHLSIKTSSLDAEIMTELIMSGKADQILKEKRVLARDANRVFDSVFPEQKESGREFSFFRCLPLSPEKCDGVKMEEQLEKSGVSAFHSNRFAVHKQSRENFLRISVSSTENMEMLQKGLEIVKQVLFTEKTQEKNNRNSNKSLNIQGEVPEIPERQFCSTEKQCSGRKKC